MPDMTIAPECVFLSRRRLATRLGVDPLTISNWTTAGILHPVKLNQKSVLYFWPTVCRDLLKFEVPSNVDQ